MYIRERRSVLVISSYPEGSQELHLVIYNSFQIAHLGHSRVGNQANVNILSISNSVTGFGFQYIKYLSR